MNRKKIYNEKEFSELVKKLADELLIAGYHFRLYKNLSKEFLDYEYEFNLSPHFWRSTFNANLLTSILVLSRAYDQREDCLTLKTFLFAIKTNQNLFSQDAIYKRLINNNNSYADSLAKKYVVEEKLLNDIKYVSNKNSKVKKLIMLRSNFLAHKNIDFAIQNEWKDNFNLDLSEIEELINKGLEILNHYRDIFCSTVYLSEMPGEDDYKFVLEAIRNLKIKYIDSEE